MKMLFLSFLICAWATGATQAQGTFIYDQESSSDEISPFGSVVIQGYSSLGQSFTPSLSTIGFVRLRQFDINPGNALGATVAVNLRSNSMSGAILGTTIPMTMTNGFAGSINFFFASAVPVTPSTTYFFETVVLSGDNWGITLLGDTYAGGSVYASGFPVSGNDLWFREGIVVPEPSTAIFLLGGGIVALFVRRRRQAN